MSRLQELALDLGCEVEDWPEADQREAVIELFERDEAKCVPGSYPDWIGDCLSERVACNEKARLEIIAVLAIDNTVERLCRLGAVVEKALLEYPQDTLTERCWSNIESWRAEERQCRAEQELDSRREAVA
jgi:hypothetical protein